MTTWKPGGLENHNYTLHYLGLKEDIRELPEIADELQEYDYEEK